METYQITFHGFDITDCDVVEAAVKWVNAESFAAFGMFVDACGLLPLMAEFPVIVSYKQDRFVDLVVWDDDFSKGPHPSESMRQVAEGWKKRVGVGPVPQLDDHTGQSFNVRVEWPISLCGTTGMDEAGFRRALAENLLEHLEAVNEHMPRDLDAAIMVTHRDPPHQL